VTNYNEWTGQQQPPHQYHGLAFDTSKVHYPLVQMANSVIGLTKLSQNF
jgi:hypothetical protein